MYFINYLKSKLFIVLRYLIERINIRKLKKNKLLWSELNEYIRVSESTGCNISDYWEIYNFVRTNKPKEILECGTGVSTIVMAFALSENEKEGFKGRITSMESVKKYLNIAKRLLPVHYKKYVNFVLSSVIEDKYSIFRGMRYKNIPMDRDYDFVYVDGPSYFCPVDGSVTFDYDLIHIIKNSDSDVSAIIDKRVSSCYVFQKLLGTKIVKYNAITHLGFVKSCNRYDLLDFNKKEPSSVFNRSFSFFNSKLNYSLDQKKFKNKV
tara:strand:+ start:2208 stop:3002 length:795 start_codon:yes stop_codon:yes gene_type:complete